MKLTEKNIISLFLWSFIIIGGLLRFYNLGEWSLTNDELSALYRTHFDSNLALWRSYGLNPDGHPPLTQLFIYNWTFLFGNTPFVVRLPFALMGILCIPISYRLFNRWFSPTTAVLVAGSIAILNYPIVYTQLARPYGMGLFFGLLFTYYWTKLIISGRYNIKTYILYVVLGICSIYIHYFLSLSIVIIMITGLILVKKHRIKTYLILNLLIAISFLPFLEYFLIQLSIGGVGGWLPKPESSFYINYLWYALNRSWLTVLLLLFIALYGIRNKFSFSRRNWVMLVWGVTPFLFGFLYSTYSNPVLQFSTLIFSFPFLLAFVFSFAETLDLRKNMNTLITVFSIILLFSSAISWKYYHESSFGEFKETSKVLTEWLNELDGEYDVIANISNPYYYNYYLKQLNFKDTFLVTSISTHSDLANLSKLLKKSTNQNLVFTWANTNNHFELKELIRYYYPSIKKSKRFNNAEVIIYEKGKSSSLKFGYQTNFNQQPKELGYSLNNIVFDTINSDNYFQTDTTSEYPVVIKDIDGANLPIDSANVVTFMVHFKSAEAPKAILAISIDNDEGNVTWRGTDLAPFFMKEDWNMALVSLYLPDGIKPTDKIKAYVWNREKEEFLIDDVSFFAYKDSHYYLK